MRRLRVLEASLKNVIRYHRFLRGLVTRRIIDLAFPAVIGLDPTTACNLKCSFCGPQQLRPSPMTLSLDLFNRVVEESLRHGRRRMLILHNSGEPLLNRDIYGMIALAKQKKVARVVQFSTNGLLLTEENCEKLVRAGLDGLVISVDAYTRREYAELKGVDCLERVIENARTMMRVKKRLSSPIPYVSAKMVRRRGFEDTFAPFLKFWREIVDEAALTPFSNWGGQMAYEGTEPLARKRFACHFLWYYPAINPDGKVFFCCASTSPGAVIGDVTEESLQEIWRGERLARARRRHLEGRFETAGPCRNCSYWSEAGVDLDRWLRRKEDGARFTGGG